MEEYNELILSQLKTNLERSSWVTDIIKNKFNMFNPLVCVLYKNGLALSIHK